MSAEIRREHLPANLPLRIYLVGMMGVGKTTLGRQLANQLHYSFLDLDKDIEQSEGRSVQQIFDEGGESSFREAEHEALMRTNERERMIIATGGGTPCFFDHMSWINDHGISVYLRANAAFISGRVAKNKDKRPLLKGINHEELEAFIEKILSQREPYYMQATHVLNLPLKSVVTSIKSIL